jgi:hypothetical protein
VTEFKIKGKRDFDGEAVAKTLLVMIDSALPQISLPTILSILVAAFFKGELYTP